MCFSWTTFLHADLYRNPHERQHVVRDEDNGNSLEGGGCIERRDDENPLRDMDNRESNRKLRHERGVKRDLIE